MNIERYLPSDLRILRLAFSEDIMAYLLNSFYLKHKVPFAGFHPKFIAEHVIAACNYLGTPPRITRQLLDDSLENMVYSPQLAITN